MVEAWHDKFNPSHFLARVNIDRFIEKNKAYNESFISEYGRPCILCNGTQGPGLLLNDKSYLCKSCFAEVSTIKYPDKYEILRRAYLKDCEARRQARDILIKGCPYRKFSSFIGIIGFISLILLFFNIVFAVIPVTCYFIFSASKRKHMKKLTEWESEYPAPIEPQLRHFHDPLAELTFRDRLILKVFNNWPGYPPFWDYLRQVIMQRDGDRCQVSGCPSRVKLHIHHRLPVSQGGEHVPTNLVTLCGFHHALEPDEGHERIWGEIKTRYFTMVCAHKRRNPSSTGYHDVRAHVRRLELVNETEISEIINFHALSCAFCGSGNLKTTVNKKNQQVKVTCLGCSENWIGSRQLTEETGPRLAEVTSVKKNKGTWEPRWDMLQTRTESTFQHLTKSLSKPEKTQKTILSKEDTTPKCPKCGSQMRLIKPRKGDRWKAFWGCKKYRITGCNGSMET